MVCTVGGNPLQGELVVEGADGRRGDLLLRQLGRVHIDAPAVLRSTKGGGVRELEEISHHVEVHRHAVGSLGGSQDLLTLLVKLLPLFEDLIEGAGQALQNLKPTLQAPVRDKSLVLKLEECSWKKKKNNNRNRFKRFLPISFLSPS